MIPLPGILRPAFRRGVVLCILALAAVPGPVSAEDAACADVTALVDDVSDMLIAIAENPDAWHTGRVELSIAADTASRSAEAAGWPAPEIEFLGNVKDAGRPEAEWSSLPVPQVNQLLVIYGILMSGVASQHCPDGNLPDFTEF